MKQPCTDIQECVALDLNLRPYMFVSLRLASHWLCQCIPSVAVHWHLMLPLWGLWLRDSCCSGDKYCIWSAEGAGSQAVHPENCAQPRVSQYQHQAAQQQILDTYLG